MGMKSAGKCQERKADKTKAGEKGQERQTWNTG